jgi:deazaflavin-dependent oxidoreductase (nitroreductase family)
MKHENEIDDIRADVHDGVDGEATRQHRYIEVDRFTRTVLNPLVGWLTRRGISVWGSRVLEVRGRRSGALRTTPVNVLSLEGERYLVAPRGETAWVQNVRAAGTATLRVGRRRETVRPIELDDAAKPDVLRAYLRRWKFEVGQFFDGVDAGASDAQLLAIAPGYPVFRLASPDAV